MIFKNTEEYVSFFKALSDLNRFKIIEMLPQGELCACKLLRQFNISQPTLSHHMKVLTECGLVSGRKEGVWMHYSLNQEKLQEIIDFFSLLSAAEIVSK